MQQEIGVPVAAGGDAERDEAQHHERDLQDAAPAARHVATPCSRATGRSLIGTLSAVAITDSPMHIIHTSS